MKTIFTLLLLLTTSFACIAQSHSLLKNIGEGDEDGIIISNQATNWNGLTYFITGVPFSKYRIWSTDGTESNTFEVLTENYPDVEFLTSIDDYLIFNGWKDTHRGIYSSDGTQAGTNLLKEFPQQRVEFMQKLDDNTVIVITENFNLDTAFWWATDGTIDGTILLGHYEVDPLLITYSYYQDKMILTEKSTGSGFPPVITDGTVDGTMLVTDYINAVSAVDEVESAVGTANFMFVNTISGGKVFDGSGLSDFTLAGSYIHAFRLSNLNVVFSNFDVMVYDSLLGSTVQLSKEFNYFSEPVSNGSKVFFHEDDDFVYETDGTVAGTKKISSTTLGNLNFDPYLFASGNNLFYNTRQPTGHELWVVDLDSGLDSLFSVYKPATAFSINPFMINVGDHLLYAKSTNADGREFWVYDDTPTSVRNLVDAHKIIISPNPADHEVIISFDTDTPLNTNVSIYNTSGMLMGRSKLTSNQIRFNISNFVPGQYFLQINSNTDVQYLGAFIKQ